MEKFLPGFAISSSHSSVVAGPSNTNENTLMEHKIRLEVRLGRQRVIYTGPTRIFALPLKITTFLGSNQV